MITARYRSILRKEAISNLWYQSSLLSMKLLKFPGRINASGELSHRITPLKALADSKLDVGFEAFGYDIDPAAVALANANAKLAGVEKRCHFEVADVADFAAKQEAIVLTNPPYGERMSTIEGAAKLARTLGRQMEALPFSD